jgi:GT2 family glycosyltransferase
MEHYAMHTLDTAYVWRVKRRQGYGLRMLQNITSSYPGNDIGFSKPISFSMWKGKVIYNFIYKAQILKCSHRLCWWIKIQKELDLRCYQVLFHLQIYFFIPEVCTVFMHPMTEPKHYFWTECCSNSPVVMCQV